MLSLHLTKHSDILKIGPKGIPLKSSHLHLSTDLGQMSHLISSLCLNKLLHL
jgi:hypothetical protein